MWTRLTCCLRSSRSTRSAPLRCGSREGCCSASSTSGPAAEEPDGGWPGVSVLIPAYNEENVIATSVTAALAVGLPGARGARPRRRLDR